MALGSPSVYGRGRMSMKWRLLAIASPWLPAQVERVISFERNEEQEMKRLTLVVGGTGKTGRRVAERLTNRGADQ